MTPYYQTAEAKRKYNRRMFEVRRQLIATAKSVPCVDCGVSYPSCVMDFDHRDPKDKLNTNSMSSWSMRVGLERLRAEIAKCDVRCANCHRLRHHHAP